MAVVLAAAECVKRKETIPLLDKDNDLHESLFGDSDEDDEWIDDEWADIDPLSVPTSRRTKAQARLAGMFATRGREELLDLLTDLSGRFPEVRKHIVETEQLASGRVDQLVRALRSEIGELTAEPAWYNPWRGDGSLPDYTHLEAQLQALADRGHADAVLDLGSELFTRGTAQVEQADEEGKTAMAIAACLEAVVAGLP